MNHPKRLWVCIGLVILILLVFGQVVRFGFTNYDDPDYVTQNPHVTSGLTQQNVSWAMTSRYAANWHPLTWISHMLDVQFFGLNGGMHHVTSVLLHAVSSILLFLALLQMTGAFWRSALLAAVFAIHPLRAESVAWVAERKDTLSTMFWMLTLFLYARYVQRSGVGTYVGMVVSYAFGLMSKAMLITLPFSLLLLDVWPLRRLDRSTLGKRIVEKVPLFVLSVASAVLTYRAQQQGGAVMSLARFPFYLRLENALISYVAYLRMLVWPDGLAAIYPFPSAIPLWEAIAAGFAVLAISLCVWRLRRSHVYLTVGWLWYLGTLVPVLGLIQIGEQARADRYTYIPCVGLLLMLVWGMFDVVQTNRLALRAGIVASIGVVVACSVLTAIQTTYWRDTAVLFKHAIDVTPANDIAYDALGTFMLDQDKPSEAIPDLSTAVELNPNRAQTHANLGMALDDLGRTAEAEREFEQAMQIDPENADAQAGLGLVLAETGKADESLSHLNEALRLRPDDAHDYFKLGEAYGLLDRVQEAEQAFRQSIRLDPSDPRTHVNLGIALGRQGKLPEAISAFRDAIQLKPDDAAAWFNLGNALAQSNQLPEAVSAFNEAVRLNPGDQDARDALAAAKQIPH